MRSPPQAVRRLHLRLLVSQARPACDVEYVTDVLVSALSATLFEHQHRAGAMPLDRLKAGYADLVARLDRRPGATRASARAGAGDDR